MLITTVKSAHAALEALHSLGVAHVRASNVLLKPNLIDFGHARLHAGPEEKLQDSLVTRRDPIAAEQYEGSLNEDSHDLTTGASSASKLIDDSDQLRQIWHPSDPSRGREGKARLLGQGDRWGRETQCPSFDCLMFFYLIRWAQQ